MESNQATSTFFCHTGAIQSKHMNLLHFKQRVRFSLDEMHEVSGLSMGELPYEEYVLGIELHLLKKDAPQVYETYWEVL